MTRSLYGTAIFFTGLILITTIFWSIIYFQLGYRVNELQSLNGWLFFQSLLSIVWSLILLKYYYHKQYRNTFWVMIVSIVVSLYHFVLWNNLRKTQEFTTHYIIVSQVMIGIGILYAASLIFSRAGERPWLKAVGIYSIIAGLIGFITFILAFGNTDILVNGTAGKIEQWLTLIGSIVPILFIINFWNERETAEKANTSHQSSLTSLMDVAALIAVGAALFFGIKLTGESIWLYNHPNQVGEYQQRLAQPFEARVYANSEGDSLQYRFMMPMNYDSTQRYPLVVCLHGSSGCGTDNVKQVASSLPAQILSTQENRKKYPAFLFVPQCPPEMSWGGIDGLPAVDSLVFESIFALEKEYPIDTDRRYLTGISLGGTGTWHLICTRPEVFAAAIPISGGGNPALAKSIVDLPVWAFHGAKDRNVPVNGSREIIEAIKEAGGHPRYSEFPDKAHNITEEVKTTHGLLEWLFAQQRE